MKLFLLSSVLLIFVFAWTINEKPTTKPPYTSAITSGHIVSNIQRLSKRTQASSKGQRVFLTLILILSGDIHPNPGPPCVYPCGICETPVNWSNCAVCCDDCSIWYHKSCFGMSTHEYERLANKSNISWICF